MRIWKVELVLLALALTRAFAAAFSLDVGTRPLAHDSSLRKLSTRNEGAIGLRLRGGCNGAFLCLTAGDGSLETEGLIVQSNAFPQQLQKEAAGQAAHRLLLRQSGDDQSDAQTTGPDTEGSGSESDTKEKDSWESPQLVGNDLYQILGLGNRRWKATDDEIKKAYHRTSLRWHPDKIAARGLQGSSLATAQEVSKKVNEAYTVLSDKDKRFGYDCQDVTFDAVPTSDTVRDPASFYKTMGEVFETNGRWSAVKPVPKLGGPSTSIDQVENFYTFWKAFKSRRDFSYNLEHDIETAKNRWERRAMQKDNEKAAKEKKLAEMDRIHQIVSLAYNHDPRILAKVMKAKQLKEEKLNAKRREKELKEKEERELREKEQREKAEALLQQEKEKANKKKQQQEAKFQARKARQALKNLVAKVWNGKKNGDTWDWGSDKPAKERGRILEELCKKLDADEVKLLTKDVDSISNSQEVVHFRPHHSDAAAPEDKMQAVYDLMKCVDNLTVEEREAVKTRAATILDSKQNGDEGISLSSSAKGSTQWSSHEPGGGESLDNTMNKKDPKARKDVDFGVGSETPALSA